LRKITVRERIHYFREVTLNSAEMYSIYNLFILFLFFLLLWWMFQCINTLHVVTKVQISRISKIAEFARWNFFHNRSDYVIDCCKWSTLPAATVCNRAGVIATFKCEMVWQRESANHGSLARWIESIRSIVGALLGAAGWCSKYRSAQWRYPRKEGWPRERVSYAREKICGNILSFVSDSPDEIEHASWSWCR